MKKSNKSQPKFQPPWSLTITRAVNGYLLETTKHLEGDTYSKEHIVVMEDPDLGDYREARCARELLWEVMEEFAIYKNIRVVIVDDDGKKVKALND